MRRRLHVSKHLSFGPDYVTKAIAILAQRRKGKTYTANKVAEQMCKAGIPWVALDPTGAWWGLRSSKDGKGDGFPVIVLGGDHGDLPLNEDAGMVVADMVVDNPGFYVLDLSHFESKAAERRFATAFADRFYRRKHKSKDPMHLFVDEADMFIPERPGKGDTTMVGAFESIVKRGGIRGIGVTLITQRSAAINKNVLEQADIYIVLRTVGPNDQKAIKTTLSAQGDADHLETLMGTMASLKLGEAWVWEPGAEPPLFEKVQVEERETFNSSATPEVGGKKVEPKLAEIDLPALGKQMESAVEEQKKNDPTHLRKIIAQRESELIAERNKTKQPPTPAPEPEEVEVEVPVFPDELRKSFESFLDKVVEQIKDSADQAIAEVERARENIRDWAKADLEGQGIARKKKGATSRPKAAPAATVPPPGTQPPPESKTLSQGDGDADPTLIEGEKKMLAVLAQQHPMKLTKQQLGTLSGYKASGGTFRTYFGKLKRLGYVTEHGRGKSAEIEITQAGFDALGGDIPKVPETLEERVQFWGSKLIDGERVMLDHLVAIHPNGCTRDELGEATGFTASGGTFRTYFGKLKRNGLADEQGGEVRAGHVLFM